MSENQLRAEPSRTAAPRPVRWWEWLIVAAITAVGAWWRWKQLATQGMWLDEAFSVWMARLAVGDLFHWITRIDQHPPLYYLLLHSWMQVAGDTESGVRSLSVLLGAATVPAIYWLARRLLGVPSAIAAALLLAFAPFHVRFAQETRMYTLYTFNATLALVGLAYLITGDVRKRWWALYIVFSALTLLSHNTAVLFWVAVNVGVGAAAGVAWLRKGRGDLALPSVRAWLIAQALILLLWLPWLPSFVRQARAVDNEFWIQPPTAQTILGTLHTLVAWYAAPTDLWIWAAALVALLLAIVALRRRPALLVLLLLLVATPFVLELGVSLRRPIFYDRTLIWTTVPLYVLMAAGVRTWRGWHAAPALVATAAISALLVANYMSLQNYYMSFRKEQWREAAAWLAERTQPGDMLIFNATWVQIPFDYYFDRYNLDVREHGAPVDMFDAGVLEPKMTKADVPRLQELAAQANCVWLIYSHDWYTDPQKIVPATLRSAMLSRKEQSFEGLKIQLYERRGGPECGEPKP